MRQRSRIPTGWLATLDDPAYNRPGKSNLPSDERLRVYLPLMINQQEKLRDVAWSELFRWLLLLRSVRIALMARVMVLGAIGLICTTLGWRAIGWVFSASTDPVLAQWHEDIRYWLWDKTPEFSIATSVHSADELFGAATRGLIEAPVTLWLYLAEPFVDLFRSDLTAIGFLCLLFCGIWELLVWGLIGGAITRIAALKFTRDEAPDLLGALAHAASKISSYSLAPLLGARRGGRVRIAADGLGLADAARLFRDAGRLRLAVCA